MCDIHVCDLYIYIYIYIHIYIDVYIYIYIYIHISIYTSIYMYIIYTYICIYIYLQMTRVPRLAANYKCTVNFIVAGRTRDGVSDGQGGGVKRGGTIN